MSLYEAGMIVCFGVSWPVAILKTLKTKSVYGKSRMFLVLVLTGYGLGILHKIFFNLDVVLLLYAFNFSMVLIELCLWFRYHERPLSVPAAAVRHSEAYGAADTLLAGPSDLAACVIDGERPLPCPRRPGLTTETTIG